MPAKISKELHIDSKYLSININSHIVGIISYLQAANYWATVSIL